MFVEYFTTTAGTLSYIDVDYLWQPFVWGAVIFAVLFAFQAIALYTIAKREGYSNRWMAFVPFLSTYYIGVCAQKNRCFSSIDSKIVGIAAAVAETLITVGFIVYIVAFLQLYSSGCIVRYQDEYINGINIWVNKLDLNATPTNLLWAAWCYEYLYTYVLQILDLVYIFLSVMILSAFFQTYASRRYFLFTITSVLFPIQGILFFVVRKNRGMAYRDYIRGEQERQYREYQDYSRRSFDQNPYNNNPYSRNPYYDNPPSNPYSTDDKKPSDDPFAEFGSEKDDPFNDLNDKH